MLGASLRPAFSPQVTLYSAVLPYTATSAQIQATPLTPSAAVYLNNAPLASGVPSTAVPLGAGVTLLTVFVQHPSGATRTYSIAVTRGSLSYLKASNTGTKDEFGLALSLSGDTLAVGAYGEASNATGINGNQADNSAPGSGAVYVFTRTGSTWTQQAYLKASSSGQGDGFGAPVPVRRHPGRRRPQRGQQVHRRQRRPV